MEVLMIAGGLVGLFIFIGIALAINEKCEERYQYKPFNIGNTSAMAIAIGLVGASLFILPEGHNIQAALEQAIQLEFPEQTLNSVALVGISILIAVFVYINLIVKTNIFVATFAFIVQLVAAVLLIVILILIHAAISDNKKKS